MEHNLCKDNIFCCDDDCQRCANLIYNRYMEQQEDIKRLKEIIEKTEWKSQQGKGGFALQFETDDIQKYKLVEKASQMAMDGKTRADVVEVKHGKWILHSDGSGTCSLCNRRQIAVWDCDNIQNYCGKCGAEMNGGIKYVKTI